MCRPPEKEFVLLASSVKSSIGSLPFVYLELLEGEVVAICD
jgi:hypothetical protein